MFSTAVETFADTDTAQPLFSQKKIAGSFFTAAKFAASWNWPRFEVPSPKNMMTTRPGLAHLLGERDADADHEVAAERAALAENSPRRVDDVHHAALAAIGAALLVGDVTEDLFRRQVARDPVGEAAVPVEHRIVGPERGERRDLASLLAGPRVQRRRQLARHRELADALLEPPRQEHLPEDPEPRRVVQGLPPTVVEPWRNPREVSSRQRWTFRPSST